MITKYIFFEYMKVDILTFNKSNFQMFLNIEIKVGIMTQIFFWQDMELFMLEILHVTTKY